MSSTKRATGTESLRGKGTRVTGLGTLGAGEGRCQRRLEHSCPGADGPRQGPPRERRGPPGGGGAGARHVLPGHGSSLLSARLGAGVMFSCQGISDKGGLV